MYNQEMSLHLEEKKRFVFIRDGIALFTILTLALIFATVKKFDTTDFEAEALVAEEIEIESIITIFEPKSVELQRPSDKIPMPMDEEEELLDDSEYTFNIEKTVFDFDEDAPPVTIFNGVDPDEVMAFFDVSEKPTIIGSMQSVYKNMTYPAMARKASISGRVTLRFICTKEGIPSEITILQEKPKDMGFGEAAKKALSKIRLTPGMQQDVPVNVRMTLPIHFAIR